MSAADRIRLTTAAALVIALAFVWLSVRLRGRGARRLLLIASLAGVLWFTVLGKTPGTRSVNLTPLWSWALWDQIDVRHPILQNVLLFVPFGAALRAAGIRHPILLAALTSAAVEALQFVFALGLCETDDVIHNTLGAALGVGLFCLGEHLTRPDGRKRS